MNKLYYKLISTYGPQGWWPILNTKTNICEYHPDDCTYPKNDEQRFEICVGAILTQNTSWKNVVKALANLKSKNFLSPSVIISCKNEELANAIRTAGYFNQKAKKLKLFSEFFISLKGLPPKRSELLCVWGVGEETADSILLYAYNLPEFVVDAYTKRIFSRIGLIGIDWAYHRIKEEFERNMPKDAHLYQEYHALIVEHAKKHCRKIPNCINCSLYEICRYH